MPRHDLEFLLDERIQEIFENFAASFGITILLCDVNGNILRRGRPNSCFCELVQSKVFSPEKCVEADRAAREKCSREQRMFHYRCHAGIEEAIAPIRFGAETIGFAMFGQYRTCGKMPDILLKLCPKNELDNLKCAFAALPFIEPARQQSVIGLFATVISYIAEHELIRTRGSSTLYDLQKWIKNNCHLPLQVEDAARRLHCSRSTVTHRLRNKLGCSFQEYLLNCRLDKAAMLLRSGQCQTIKEAAAAVGYDDPGYFSRLYKKKRGTMAKLLKSPDDGAENSAI